MAVGYSGDTVWSLCLCTSINYLHTNVPKLLMAPIRDIVYRADIGWGVRHCQLTEGHK